MKNICCDVCGVLVWFSTFQGPVQERKSRGVLCLLLSLILMTTLAACDSGTSAGGSTNGSPPNQAPSFMSATDISVPENTTKLPTVIAVDVDGDPIAYSIVGGHDADQFLIDSQSGELSFKQAPDYDAPTDSNANNAYIVRIEASDGTNTALDNLVVSVIDTGLEVTLAPGNIKTLRFSWPTINGVTHYKLNVNPDNVSGYMQVGENIATRHTEVTIPVHLTDWVNSRYMLEGYYDQGLVYRSEPVAIADLMIDSIGYIKAFNAEPSDDFGGNIALSADGNTLAVGATGEDSAATGVNGDQDDNTADFAGAVYVFSSVGGAWTQQAYIKASNTEDSDGFGNSVALSADGNTLVVGAQNERSAATGVDGDQVDNTVFMAGAVYAFTRVNGVWEQHAYVKASNAEAGGSFGVDVALSADGNTLAVGASNEDSTATGINGDQDNNWADDSGAVYVFSRMGGAWAQEAYVKASNTDVGDDFGRSVVLSADGNTLAVGARNEDSTATGINGDQDNNWADDSGAVYVFSRMGGAWVQEAYVKASNTDAWDEFGNSVALSADGNTLAVGALREDSAATGIGGDQHNNAAYSTGAVYVFNRVSGVWAQHAYVKASNAETGDSFGGSVALSADGNTLAVGAVYEDSAVTGIGGDQYNNTAYSTGAVYVFNRVAGVWAQHAYVKASNTEEGDGSSLVALSADGDTLAVAAQSEDSASTGIGGEQGNNGAPFAGAVYLY